MGEKRESEGKGGGESRTIGLVPKGPVRFQMVPNEQSTTERVTVQIGKAKTDECRCGAVMTGTHVVEECPELVQWRPRRAVWKEWGEALGERVVSKKEAEEEGDLLGAFFYRVYEFLPVPVIHKPSGPARYAINFVRPSFVDVDSVNALPSVTAVTTVAPVISEHCTLYDNHCLATAYD